MLLSFFRWENQGTEKGKSSIHRYSGRKYLNPSLVDSSCVQDQGSLTVP